MQSNPDNESRVGDLELGKIGPEEGPVMVFAEPDAGGVVAASNGWDVYHVWQFEGIRRPWECECPSYRIRGEECKHISAVKASIRSGSAVPGVIRFWRKS